MQVLIDLGGPFRDGETLESAILDRAAQQIADGVERTVREKINAQISEVTNEELRSLIRPMLEQAVTQLLQPTDSFGNPRGPARTLQEVIVEMATKELQKPGDRYNHNSPSVLQKLLHDEVERTIRGELQVAMRQARAEVIDAVKAEGAKVVTDTIARIANV